MVARNMQRIQINIPQKKSCVKLVTYQNYKKVRGQKNIRYKFVDVKSLRNWFLYVPPGLTANCTCFILPTLYLYVLLRILAINNFYLPKRHSACRFFKCRRCMFTVMQDLNSLTHWQRHKIPNKEVSLPGSLCFLYLLTCFVVLIRN